MKTDAQKLEAAGVLAAAERMAIAARTAPKARGLDNIEVFMLEPGDFCGHKDCRENREGNGICIYNPLDLGIAIGSAVGVAADMRIDTRIMLSAGRAAINIGLFSPAVKIAMAVPMSVSGKNPFFDRIK